MKTLKLAKSVAYAMAEDIRVARQKVIGKATIEETYELMILIDALKDMGDQTWMESLSNRFERGQHYLARNLNIEDPAEAQAIANEMAADLRELKERRAEDCRDNEVTEERLKAAEVLFEKHGIQVNLTSRLQSGGEDWPN
ncbi:MAG TPA: hypothetical protein VGL56_04560 [Fimbriimonadaceae bacterium]|jgi:hypothetical protein